MSATTDRERAEIRAEEKNARLEKFLLELLAVVRSRARRQPSTAIAALIDRGERTVYRRFGTLNELEGVIEGLERKGIKKSEY